MLATAKPVSVPPLPVTVKPPTGIVLVFRPMVAPVIIAVTVQEPLAGIVPALIETVDRIDRPGQDNTTVMAILVRD